jgi:hypothetical protein
MLVVLNSVYGQHSACRVMIMSRLNLTSTPHSAFVPYVEDIRSSRSISNECHDNFNIDYPYAKRMLAQTIIRRQTQIIAPRPRPDPIDAGISFVDKGKCAQPSQNTA